MLGQKKKKSLVPVGCQLRSLVGREFILFFSVAANDRKDFFIHLFFILKPSRTTALCMLELDGLPCPPADSIIGIS